jgi:hypothetical protein
LGEWAAGAYRGEHVGGGDGDATPLRDVLDGLVVVPAGEVGNAVGHQERPDVTHKGFHRGGLAADVRVHAGDQELVAAALGELLGEAAALECAVASLRQPHVTGLGRQLVDDLLGARVGVDHRADAVTPRTR